MEAREILRQQHEEIRGLFKKITTGGGDANEEDVQERDGLLARLTARLRLHTRLEETYFYPALEQLDTKRSHEAVLESYEEHAIVDSVLVRLPAVERSSDRFGARVRVLQFLVETHIDEEEQVMFELAGKLGEERLTALGEKMITYATEVERLERLAAQAAEAARRTERLAARWLDRGMELPRRAIGRLQPTRLLRLDERSQWIGVLAASVPTWLVDGAFNAIAGLDTMRRPNGQQTHRRSGATREKEGRAA